MIKAVIDIGTNSTRLCIAKVTDKAGERSKVFEVQKYLTTTRLGQGSAAGILQQEPMRRTAEAVSQYVEKAESASAQEIYIYATAAVREAQNSEEFAALIAGTGASLQILSGEQEALIAFTGAAESGGTSGENTAVIDIGGGSTEVMVKHGQMLAMSRKLGAVRLQELFDGRGGISDDCLAKVRALIEPEIQRYEKVRPRQAARLVGVSGTATTLGAMRLGLERYSGAVQGIRLSLLEVRDLMHKLFLPLEQRLLIPGVPNERGDILPFGAIILESFMTVWGFDFIDISDTDSLEGFLMLSTGSALDAVPYRPHI